MSDNLDIAVGGISQNKGESRNSNHKKNSSYGGLMPRLSKQGNTMTRNKLQSSNKMELKTTDFSELNQFTGKMETPPKTQRDLASKRSTKLSEGSSKISFALLSKALQKPAGPGAYEVPKLIGRYSVSNSKTKNAPIYSFPKQSHR
jgi:hypothetical protein